MAIKEKDIKLLWGRAGGKCSFSECRRKLCEDKKANNEAFPVGEQSHIVAEEQDGPRGKSVLTIEERNSYPNLILLCPTHHTLIDKNIEDYPVEKLHLIKRQHELYIEQTTSQIVDAHAQAAELIYASIIDAAVDMCGLKDWGIWTSWLVAAAPRWNQDRVDKIHRFREKVIAVPWPKKNPELEGSLITLSIGLEHAANRFLDHVQPGDDDWFGYRFYKNARSDEQYDRMLDQYERWTKDCEELIIESTKAANWFSEVVRRDINPSFFAVEGKFLLTWQHGLGFRTAPLEYTLEEKRKQPDLLTQIIENMNKIIAENF